MIKLVEIAIWIIFIAIMAICLIAFFPNGPKISKVWVISEFALITIEVALIFLWNTLARRIL